MEIQTVLNIYKHGFRFVGLPLGILITLINILTIEKKINIFWIICSSVIKGNIYSIFYPFTTILIIKDILIKNHKRHFYLFYDNL